MNQQFLTDAILSTLVSSFNAIVATNTRLDTLIELTSASLEAVDITADNTEATVDRLQEILGAVTSELSVNITHVGTIDALTVNNNGTFL